ncbi:MAG: SDR family oxidoreductase [Ignavibacteriae bacterium]|nr:SDR family oxidoreductase [Ignavibacteriota bacterium]
MMNKINGYVLITGGSCGIGLELARVFALNRHNIILVARNEQRLQTVANELKARYDTECEVMAIDLSLPESAKELYERIHTKHLTVEIVINNAGFGTWGNYWELDEEKERGEMQLNMVTLALLTKYFLREMVVRKSGKILNVASTAAFQPGPMMAIYYATKSFVVSFSEALSKETEGTGVTVATLCPGPTETEFQRHAGMSNMHLLKSIFMMNAHEVAETAYSGLMKGKRMIVPGAMNTIVTCCVRFLPKQFLLSMVHGLHKKRGVS